MCGRAAARPTIERRTIMSGIARAPATRQHPTRVYTALKSASADVLDRNGGTPSAARRTRGSDETLRRAIRHDWPDSWLAIDQLIDLEPRCEHPFVTAELAAASGFLLVPSPERIRADGLAARSIKEAAEAIAAISEAQASGKGVERNAVPHVRREVREAILALFAYDEELERLHPDLLPERVPDRGGF